MGIEAEFEFMPLARGSRAVLSVVHISDLHLLVGDDGRSIAGQSARMFNDFALWAARKSGWSPLSRGLDGRQIHNSEAWRILKKLLPELVTSLLDASPGVPVVIAQTGDFEAYGLRNPDAPT